MHFSTLLLGTMLPVSLNALPSSLEDRAAQAVKMLEFNCANIPKVCANMCWGAYCQNVETALRYDKPSSTTKSSRRRKAGCKPNPNRCANVAGHNCDEYPFATTYARGGGSKKRVNRCVPEGQNSKQGSTLKTFYSRSCGKKPCNLNVVFGNPGVGQYCQIPQGVGNCASNHEKVGPGPFKRDTGKLFRLASGREVAVPDGAALNETVYRVVPVNATLWEEQTAAHEVDEDGDLDQYDYMMDNLEIEEDPIVEELA